MRYEQSIKILENEFWWGGAIHDGSRMPLTDQSDYEIDLRTQSRGNQAVPFFLSSKGRYIWSEDAFHARIKNGIFTVSSDTCPIEFTDTKGNLQTAYKGAMNRHFPFSGVFPEEIFYTKPQYNTWVELLYNQNQQGVLDYAENILKNGFEPGILMIDDTWQTNYGVWEFDKIRFPDPKAMCDKLHEMGFRILLWIVPYLSADSATYRQAVQIPHCLIEDAQGAPQIIRWWNGISAAIDFTMEAGRQWMDQQLFYLMDKYGVDGFKFDGGSIEEYTQLTQATGVAAPVRTKAYFDYAAKYRFHEFKDTWKAGGCPFNQRLRDKCHSWDGEGLSCIVPDAIALSLTGHPFQCPDMIGGGEWTCFLPGGKLDPELIIRSAQLASVFPMMQFSVAPWRILSAEDCELVRQAARFHCNLIQKLLPLLKETASSGDPILAPLCYWFPDKGYEQITDEIMIGQTFLVAPVLEKSVSKRNVVFPDGEWIDLSGKVYSGGQTITIDVTLSDLPLFKKIK